MFRVILNFTIIAFLFCFNVANAQNFHGRAIYESKTKTGDIKITSSDMTEEMKQMMTEKLAKAFEKTFTLDFNKSESFYYQEVKLEAPARNNSGINIKTNGGEKKLYKNSKEKIALTEDEFFGKEFLITSNSKY